MTKCLNNDKFETKYQISGALAITLRQTSESFDIGHEVLPKGTRLVLFNFLIHQCKDIWGEQADKFNPDNFLPENVSKRHNYSYVPYGMVKKLHRFNNISSLNGKF